MTVNVEPASQAELEALKILSSPEDYIFLELGEREYAEEPEIISHLKQVVEKSGNTLLAKWAAGRLGLVEFDRFQYGIVGGFAEFAVKYRAGQVKDPVYEQARKYLTIAEDLPDGFPMKEEVLYRLSQAEYMTGNYNRTESLLDELALKYAHGKYGKRSGSDKKELADIRKQIESELATIPVATTTPSWWGYAMWIAGGAVAVATACLVLVLKKKRQPQK